jgi:integrase
LLRTGGKPSSFLFGGFAYAVNTTRKLAFNNDKVGGYVLKAFRKIKNKTRRGAGARGRTVAIGEYLRLLVEAPQHLRAFLIIAMNTGMRPGEIRGLKWSYVDRQAGMIRLPAEVTKEKRPKLIPINHHVQAVLDAQIRAIHHDYVVTMAMNH